MTYAYVVGNIKVKHPEKWAEYQTQVPETLVPWNAEIVFRGKQAAVLGGQHPYPNIVVIRFPDMAAVNNWFSSSAYQALIPLRHEAAEVALLSYET